MNIMQKFNNKNNKGFSLVELIVVILIIGVLAVAIAPQVTKWVGTAKTNQQTNEKATLQAAVQVALADYEGEKGTLATETEVSIPKGTAAITAKAGSTTNQDLEEKLNEVIIDERREAHTFTISTGGAVKAK